MGSEMCIRDSNNTILKAKEEIKMLILGDKEHARELMAVMDAYDI